MGIPISVKHIYLGQGAGSSVLVGYLLGTAVADISGIAKLNFDIFYDGLVPVR